MENNKNLIAKSTETQFEDDILINHNDFIKKLAKQTRTIKFDNITSEMIDLYTKKNTDYGNSFDKSLDEDGLLVAKIRLHDKLNRFSTLIKQGSLVNDESLEDTLIDIANYSVMTIMYLRNKKNEDGTALD